MTDRLSHDEIRALLGAHALGATETEEASAVDRHVAGCEECSDELGRHTRVVAVLPLEDPSEAATPLRSPTDRRSRSASWIWAAALVVAVSGFAVQTWRVDDLAGEVGALRAELDEPIGFDAVAGEALGRAYRLTDGEGEIVAVLRMTADGRGIVTHSSLGPPPDDRIYQLWAVLDGEVVSAGILTDRPVASPFRVEPRHLEGFAITEEESGGVAASSRRPLASWQSDA